MTNIDPHIDPADFPHTVEGLEELRDGIQAKLIEKRKEIAEHEVEQAEHSKNITKYREAGDEAKAQEETDLLRKTLTEERELSAEKIAFVKTLKAVNAVLEVKIEEREAQQMSELRQRHVDEALEGIRDSLGVPPFASAALHEDRMTAIVAHLEDRSDDKPLYLKKNDLKENHKMGIDNVIIDEFVAALQEKPVLLLEKLAGAAESSDVEEANVMLRKAHEHWNRLEEEYPR